MIAIIAILAAILFPVFAKAREKARAASCLSNCKTIGQAAQMYSSDYDGYWTAPFRYDAAGPGDIVCSTRAGETRVRIRWWQDLLQPYAKNYQVFRCPSGNWTINATGCRAPSTGQPGPLVSGYAVNTLSRWTLTPSFQSSLCQHTGYRIPGDEERPFSGFDCGGHVSPGFNWKSPSDSAIESPGTTIWIVDSTTPEIWNEDYTDYGRQADRNMPPNQCPVVAGAMLPPVGIPLQPRQCVSSRHIEGFNSVFGDGHAKWLRWRTTKPCNWSIQLDGC